MHNKQDVKLLYFVNMNVQFDNVASCASLFKEFYSNVTLINKLYNLQISFSIYNLCCKFESKRPFQMLATPGLRPQLFLLIKEHSKSATKISLISNNKLPKLNLRYNTSDWITTDCFLYNFTTSFSW